MYLPQHLSMLLKSSTKEKSHSLSLSLSRSVHSRRAILLKSIHYEKTEDSKEKHFKNPISPFLLLFVFIKRVLSHLRTNTSAPLLCANTWPLVFPFFSYGALHFFFMVGSLKSIQSKEVVSKRVVSMRVQKYHPH